jgi:hypothetical protein
VGRAEGWHLLPPAPGIPVLWAVFHPDAPSQRLTALPVMFAVACVWLAVVGAVYLYLALSGGVMSEAERRRRGDGADAP